jgi:uncharacterized membrane protein YoaK (UPF0700 family)
MAENNSPLESVSGACLLALAGGMLDAMVFMTQGHVFVCAMTGNVIFMGIAVVARDWAQAARHGSLLVAFFLGIAGSMFLRARRAAVWGIVIEIVALMVLGATPRGFSPEVLTLGLAFSASLQVATFRKVNGFAYNSAFVTGNLRSVAEASYLLIFPGEREALAGNEIVQPAEKQRAEVSGLMMVFGAFCLGGLVGAWLAAAWGNRSLWAAVVPLVLAVGIAWRHRPAMEAARADG